MSRETRKTPVYQRYRESGSQAENRAGVQATLKAGDDATGDKPVTWLVEAASLQGLVPIPERDCLKDTVGRWWTVKSVGALVEGAYPLTCVRFGTEG